jgi:hypothetical protein
MNEVRLMLLYDFGGRHAFGLSPNEIHFQVYCAQGESRLED